MTEANDTDRRVEPAGRDVGGPTGTAGPETEYGIVLTPSQLRSRRNRNIAIGLAVGFFAILFYVVSIAKFGLSVPHKG